MTHAETEIRHYIVGVDSQEELEALVRKVKMRMQLDGLHNVRLEIEPNSTGDYSLTAAGDRIG